MNRFRRLSDRVIFLWISLILSACSQPAVSTSTLTIPPTVPPTSLPPQVFFVSTPTSFPIGRNQSDPFPGQEAIGESDHFIFYSLEDYLPVDLHDWQIQAEKVYAYVSARTGLKEREKVKFTFAQPEHGPCPPRAETAASEITIYADQQTDQKQIIASLAHELGHVFEIDAQILPDSLALTEGFATWTAGKYWLDWHGTSSFDALVTSYLDVNTYSPLSQNQNLETVMPGATNAGDGGDCLARRDILYSEWAAFIDYLLQQGGTEKLYDLFRINQAKIPETQDIRVPITLAPPDYQKVYGAVLEQLEADWLATLVTPSPTPTPSPTRTEMVQPCEPMVASPVFVYLEGDTLFQQAGCQPPERWAELSDLGELFSAIQAGSDLFLLRAQGIERVDLSAGKNDLLIPFDPPGIYSLLAPSPDQKRVFYAETITDQASPMGFTTNIGTFDSDGTNIQPVSTQQRSMRILGQTADGKGLYCLPLGQDPDFATVQVFDIATGKIGEELPVRGYDIAVLAPNSRSLATFLLKGNPNGAYENSINIYDLPSLPQTPPKVFPLPNAPSFVGYGGLYWSPDGQSIYFLLVKNPYDVPVVSYGLWRLNVQSGKMDQIAPEIDAVYHLIGLSPDGKWVLLKHESQEESLLVNLQTGETKSFSSSILAILVGWQ